MNTTAKEKGQQAREIILQCIICYIEEHGYPPSIREICDITEIKSTATVHHHITKMLESGMLETDCGWGTPRALRVPGYRFVKMD